MWFCCIFCDVWFDVDGFWIGLWETHKSFRTRIDLAALGVSEMSGRRFEAPENTVLALDDAASAVLQFVEVRHRLQVRTMCHSSPLSTHFLGRLSVVSLTMRLHLALTSQTHIPPSVASAPLPCFELAIP